MRHTPYISIIAFAAVFLMGSSYPFNLSLKPGDVGLRNPSFLNVRLGSDYGGTYTITYANGATAGPVSPGDSVPATGNTIKSITTSAGEILIGRPDTDSITLNIKTDGSLDFRPADGDGFIPIGAYAEFQLINTDATTLAGKYKQEADLDLMSEEWAPVGRASGNRFLLEPLTVTVIISTTCS
jgi:hypothetical protein